jgi:hypothetical protein
MKNLFIILGCAMLASCSTAGLKVQKINRIEHKIVQKNVALKKNEQIYIAAAIDALNQVPVANKSKQEFLALRLLTNAQSIAGVPVSTMKLNVNLLLDDNKNETKKLADKEKEDANNIVAKEKLIEQEKVLQEKVNAEAVKLAAEHNKNIFTKISHWIGLILIIGAGAVLLYFFGPIIIPLAKTIFSALRNLIKGLFG